MQNTERYYGFRAEVSNSLTPEDYRLWRQRAAELVVELDILPENYFVYFHQLVLLVRDEHFGVLNLANRAKEITLGFNVNKKQVQSGKLRFLNHLFVPNEKAEFQPWYRPDELGYVIPADYFRDRKYFQNGIISFVDKSLRKVDRKIKVSVSVTPTRAYALRLQAEVRDRVTQLDMKFDKKVQLKMPWDSDDSEGVKNMSRNVTYNIGKVVNNGNATFGPDSKINVNIVPAKVIAELKILLHNEKKSSTSNHSDIIDLENAIDIAERGSASDFVSKIKPAGTWIARQASAIGLAALESYVKQKLGLPF